MQFVVGVGNLIVLIGVSFFAGIFMGVAVMALCSAARSDNDPLEETPFNKDGDLSEKYNDLYNKIEDNLKEYADKQEVDN